MYVHSEFVVDGCILQTTTSKPHIWNMERVQDLETEEIIFVVPKDTCYR